MRWSGGWIAWTLPTAITHWKADGLDLTPLLTMPDVPASVAHRCVEKQDHGLDKTVDLQLIELTASARENGTPVSIEMPIHNSNRTVGTMLSGKIAAQFGAEGLPDDTIRVNFTGSGGAVRSERS